MPVSKPDLPGEAPSPKASPKVAEAPSAPESPALPLRPAAEASDPDVHRLLFERHAASQRGDQAELRRVADALGELGFA